MKLKEERFIRCCSQSKLAKKANLKQPTISLIENNLIRPSKKHKEAICRALQVDENKIDWENEK